MKKVSFAADYLEGAYPTIIKALSETNLLQTSGYGFDDFCSSAREKIRHSFNAPKASVDFLVGGTQTNATVIDALLHNYEAVLTVDSGHINMCEAGAIEFCGHKVLTVPHKDGKITSNSIKDYLKNFYENKGYGHMVQPKLIYISQPTEYGTLYSKQELTDIHQICKEYDLKLYVDGARLAYALATPENDVSLNELYNFSDAICIGGTKCGALFGEAVIAKPNLLQNFFTVIKQHGALLAKGRLLGIQFDQLFSNDLYQTIGESAIKFANEIKNALKEKGYRLLLDTPTNQIFVIMDNQKLEKFSQTIGFTVWKKIDENNTIIRLVTSWATTKEQVNILLNSL